MKDGSINFTELSEISETTNFGRRNFYLFFILQRLIVVLRRRYFFVLNVCSENYINQLSRKFNFNVAT